MRHSCEVRKMRSGKSSQYSHLQVEKFWVWLSTDTRLTWPMGGEEGSEPQAKKWDTVSLML